MHLTMRSIVYALVWFACASQARRIQSNAGDSQQDDSENAAMKFDVAPALQSLIQLLQSSSNVPRSFAGLPRTRHRRPSNPIQDKSVFSRRPDLQSQIRRLSGGSDQKGDEDLSDGADLDEFEELSDFTVPDIPEDDSMAKFSKDDVQALKDMMADPKFQEETRRAAEQIKAVFADPKFQEEAKRAVKDFQTAMADAGKKSKQASGQNASDRDDVLMRAWDFQTEGKQDENEPPEKDCEELLKRAQQGPQGEINSENVAEALSDVMRMLQDPDCQESVRKFVSEQMSNGDVPDLSKMKRKMRFYAGVLVAVVLLAVLGFIQLLKLVLNTLLR